MDWLKRKFKQKKEHYWYFTLVKKTKEGELLFAWWMEKSEDKYPPIQKVSHDYCDRFGSRPHILSCVEVDKAQYDERIKNIKTK